MRKKTIQNDIFIFGRFVHLQTSITTPLLINDKYIIFRDQQSYVNVEVPSVPSETGEGKHHKKASHKRKEDKSHKEEVKIREKSGRKSPVRALSLVNLYDICIQSLK